MQTGRTVPCLVVFADDYGGHPSSCQHLFRHAPPAWRVLWVNTVGMRTPRLTLRDFAKIFQKLGRMCRNLGVRRGTSAPRPQTLEVLQPPMLPFSRVKWVRSLNRASVCSSVRRHLKRSGMKLRILVATVPNAGDYAECLGAETVVYYCVDDFSEWPGLDKDLVLAMERQLILKAQVLIATSDNLLERLSGPGRDVHLLTHGVDVDAFALPPAAEHPRLQGVPRPRVGYFGLFDDRSDKELIRTVARRMRDVSFVITGAVETDIAQLREEANIHFTGSIPYAELPAMAKGWEVCILPYKVNELTDAIQPLKLKEYLATGKPVVSTPIREALKLRHCLTVAGAADDWERHIRYLLAHQLSPEERRVRAALLRDESWERKAQRFFSLCLGTDEPATPV